MSVLSKLIILPMLQVNSIILQNTVLNKNNNLFIVINLLKEINLLSIKYYEYFLARIIITIVWFEQ